MYVHVLENFYYFEFYLVVINSSKAYIYKLQDSVILKNKQSKQSWNDQIFFTLV